ncbi:Aste57867_9703 [Aphanomyces stellatus]|uniref:Aste57867_9703 protein n=1 Tax=Aphanomyces stellatus TaxID=120398 RepID=A0A485KNK1_9STRA|nr:hypothetical protein As57867_009665 [Aphanomyces stellatus]VFT86582.1 Aste57867_9703 [Aphanomyces stellatus]
MPNLSFQIILPAFIAGVDIFHVIHGVCLRHIQAKITAARLAKDTHHLSDPGVQFTLALIMSSAIVRSMAFLCALPLIPLFLLHLQNPAKNAFVVQDANQYYGLAIVALFNGEYLWEIVHTPTTPPVMIAHHVISISLCAVSCHCRLFDDMGFAYAFGVLILHPLLLAKFLRHAKCSWSYPVWRFGIYYFHVAEVLGTMISVYTMYCQNLPPLELILKSVTVLMLTLVKCALAKNVRKGLGKCTTIKCDVTNAVVTDILGLPDMSSWLY